MVGPRNLFGWTRLRRSVRFATAGGTILLLVACAKTANEGSVDTGAAMAPAPAAMDSDFAHMDSTASPLGSDVSVGAGLPTPAAAPEIVRRLPEPTTGEPRVVRHREIMHAEREVTRAAPMIILPLPRESLPTPRITDSAVALRSHAADSVSALEKAMAELRAARVSFDSPDTLVVDEPAEVSVVITPGSSDTVSRGGSAPVHPDTTRISDVTQVCLSAPGFRVQNEAGEERPCRDQPVSRRNPSTWTWILTPLSQQIRVSGRRPVKLTVNAILPGYSPYTVYSSTHSTYVQVKGPSRIQKFQNFLDEWKALLLSLGAIIGVLVPVFRWLRSRQT